MKTVILVNVGTPESTEVKDVEIYLKEFLMDENIISIPRPFRDILVKALIVPKRKVQSAEKYKKIWTNQGSPLMVHTLALQKKLQAQLGGDWNVVIGMQVGKPALKEVVEKHLKDDLYFCPLYPQFATATTGGALSAVRKVRTKLLTPFYSESWFIEAQAAKIKEFLQPQDHLLLSYHGLPISQLKEHYEGCYKNAVCCQISDACEMNCYKAQCLKTTSLIQEKLQWTEVSTGFQSRLGPAKWIEPSTEQVVSELRAKGVRHLKVACPSFVADCLETLEEIGIELRRHFLEKGGETFELIPCVNESDLFVQGLSNKLRSMEQKGHAESAK